MRYPIVIVGGGTAGISTAARLLREHPSWRGQVAIVEPAEKHYYQPLWTLVGAGAAPLEATERDEASLIPPGAVWIRDAVVAFRPEQGEIELASGAALSYDALVVSMGIQMDWNKIKGLEGNIGRNGICSNYTYEYVQTTWSALQKFRGGNAVFTMPETPIKCGGAPQKIAYLADDYLRKKGVRHKAQIHFVTGTPTIFSVKKYADALMKVVERKHIHTHFKHRLIEVKADDKVAVFENLDTGETMALDFDLLHVVPPMSAPDVIKQSPLANEAGWVDVDKFTLQHVRYPNVFSLGDCSSLPTSKTGAAIRKQVPVLVHNLTAYLANRPVEAEYHGYTSCPLVTGYGRLILAEFDYSHEPEETFPFDQGQERFSMYVLKKSFLPVLYWDGMLKGLM
ncbi:MAG: NAD(P)/FAD-dependent oxidoreductase [Alicyclobacillus mali]|uniref:NAD(P)/FAD-dependent oxidoreductase n=1 Tax=Alicyclobacillus mali (ex Roth et al. 2021) TaxID=1123961 RepID=UPI001A8C9A92|nr:FAD/NAD(P)-binding oxidoreductase [Alicyclobacillus mali (ex Roth et al. 2021)]MCL6489512.1 NAD(P)/FAD-dependent oxidoreductase [Alicyclobacillus mali (ex Roth et al. 2021)]